MTELWPTWKCWWIPPLALNLQISTVSGGRLWHAGGQWRIMTWKRAMTCCFAWHRCLCNGLKTIPTPLWEKKLIYFLLGYENIYTHAPFSPLSLPFCVYFTLLTSISLCLSFSFHFLSNFPLFFTFPFCIFFPSNAIGFVPPGGEGGACFPKYSPLKWYQLKPAARILRYLSGSGYRHEHNHLVWCLRNLGVLTSLRLGHDNAGLTPNWLVEHVLIRNEFTGWNYSVTLSRKSFT